MWLVHNWTKLKERNYKGKLKYGVTKKVFIWGNHRNYEEKYELKSPSSLISFNSTKKLF